MKFILFLLVFYIGNAFSSDALPECVNLQLNIHGEELAQVKSYLAGTTERKKYWPSKGILAAAINDLDYIKESKDKEILFGAFYVALSSGRPNTNDLIALFSDINLRSKDDLTPLMMAINCNQVDTVKKIISLGGDVNLKVKDTGYDPLILATLTKNTNLVNLLINKGANCKKSNLSNGLTVLDVAKKMGTPAIENKIKECINK